MILYFSEILGWQWRNFADTLISAFKLNDIQCSYNQYCKISDRTVKMMPKFDGLLETVFCSTAT